MNKDSLSWVNLRSLFNSVELYPIESASITGFNQNLAYPSPDST